MIYNYLRNTEESHNMMSSSSVHFHPRIKHLSYSLATFFMKLGYLLMIFIKIVFIQGTWFVHQYIAQIQNNIQLSEYPVMSDSKNVMVQKKESDLSVFLIIVWLLNIVGSFAVTSYSLYLFANHSYHMYFLPQGLNPDQALFLTFKYLLIMFFLTNLAGELVHFIWGTGDFHRSLVNINSNTLNHTIITAGLMLYDQASLVNDGLFIHLLDLYLVGRLLFSIGYAFGTLIGHQSLRATGFGFTIACIAISGTHLIGFDLIENFKNIL